MRAFRIRYIFAMPHTRFLQAKLLWFMRIFTCHEHDLQFDSTEINKIFVRITRHQSQKLYLLWQLLSMTYYIYIWSICEAFLSTKNNFFFFIFSEDTKSNQLKYNFHNNNSYTVPPPIHWNCSNNFVSRVIFIYFDKWGYQIQISSNIWLFY